MLVSNGFSIPPEATSAEAPFVPFPPTQLTPSVLESLRNEDEALLKMINGMLALIGAKPMDSLRRIYEQAHVRLLTTWPQLDHFGDCSVQIYLGVKPPPPGAAAEWSEGNGQKVFGYLNVMPSMEQFLRGLVNAQLCALLLVRNLPQPLRERFSSEHIRFIDGAVNLEDVARQASWVVRNCNHNTVAYFAARSPAIAHSKLSGASVSRVAVGATRCCRYGLPGPASLCGSHQRQADSLATTPAGYPAGRANEALGNA
jgi:hypothetical protein